MKFFKKLFIFIFIILVIGISLVTFLGYTMYKNAINTVSLNDKITRIMSDEHYVLLDDISDDFKNAIISIEDHRFYTHKGIDIISLCRAIVTNLKTQELSQGGSTITQQLCKNMYFTQEKQFTRKIAEVFLSFDLEKNYSKDKILELYINTIYFGDGYYGIGEASTGYLKKTPKDLTLDESSLLAGLPNAPSAYSPTKNIKLAKERQKKVLRAMVEYEYITPEEMNKITNQ